MFQAHHGSRRANANPIDSHCALQAFIYVIRIKDIITSFDVPRTPVPSSPHSPCDATNNTPQTHSHVATDFLASIMPETAGTNVWHPKISGK